MKCAFFKKNHLQPCTSFKLLGAAFQDISDELVVGCLPQSPPPPKKKKCCTWEWQVDPPTPCIPIKEEFWGDELDWQPFWGCCWNQWQQGRPVTWLGYMCNDREGSTGQGEGGMGVILGRVEGEGEVDWRVVLAVLDILTYLSPVPPPLHAFLQGLLMQSSLTLRRVFWLPTPLDTAHALLVQLLRWEEWEQGWAAHLIGWTCPRSEKFVSKKHNG